MIGLKDKVDHPNRVGPFNRGEQPELEKRTEHNLTGSLLIACGSLTMFFTDCGRPVQSSPHFCEFTAAPSLF